MTGNTLYTDQRNIFLIKFHNFVKKRVEKSEKIGYNVSELVERVSFFMSFHGVRLTEFGE